MTSLVCLRPRSTSPVIRSCASSVVTRPRLTASLTASSMRSRVSISSPIGSTRPLEMASRSSAALVADAAAASARACVALRAFGDLVAALRLAAPFFAAVERFVWLALRV